jgi:hypothetical protein
MTTQTTENTETAPTIPATLPCKGCKGIGIKPALISDGKVLIKEKQCFDCSGSGTFSAPDLTEIIALIKGRKGIRSRRPDDRRAYYVWRLARFHGGQDMTMPVMAEMDSSSDPYKDLLDLWAQAVAKHVYGSGTTGTERWQRAMYG